MEAKGLANGKVRPATVALKKVIANMRVDEQEPSLAGWSPDESAKQDEVLYPWRGKGT